MEETKKTEEATKSEELAEPVERVELTDEQLDQASGGWAMLSAAEEQSIERRTPDPKCFLTKKKQ